MARSILNYSLLAGFMLILSLVLTSSARADAFLEAALSASAESPARSIGAMETDEDFVRLANDIKAERMRAALEIVRDKDLRRLIPLGRGIRTAVTEGRRFDTLIGHDGFRMNTLDGGIGVGLDRDLAACYSKDLDGSPFVSATPMTNEAARQKFNLRHSADRGIVIMLQCQGRMIGTDQDMDRIKGEPATHIINLFYHFDDPKLLEGCSTPEWLKARYESAHREGRLTKADGVTPRRFGARASEINFDQMVEVCARPVHKSKNDRIASDATGVFRRIGQSVITVETMSDARTFNRAIGDRFPPFEVYDPEIHDLRRCNESDIAVTACARKGVLDTPGVDLRDGIFKRGGTDGPARGALQDNARRILGRQPAR